jgi:hypothetical protein
MGLAFAANTSDNTDFDINGAVNNTMVIITTKLYGFLLGIPSNNVFLFIC